MIGWFLVCFSILMNSFSFCWTNNLVWKIQNVLFSCLFHGTNWNVLWSELIETIVLGEFTIHKKTYIEISKSILTIKLSKQIKFTFQLNWLNESYKYAFIIHKSCFFYRQSLQNSLMASVTWWFSSARVTALWNLTSWAWVTLGWFSSWGKDLRALSNQWHTEGRSKSMSSNKISPTSW